MEALTAAAEVRIDGPFIVASGLGGRLPRLLERLAVEARWTRNHADAPGAERIEQAD